RNQDGAAPWSTIADLTFVYNIVRHAASGINMAGEDNIHPSQQLQRVLIRDNLFTDIDGPTWGGDGRLWQVVSPNRPALGIVIDHNTGFSSNVVLTAGDSGAVAQNFVCQNNITQHGMYGVKGSGQAEGLSTLSYYFPGYVFQKNVIVGANASS